jgi:hypothetical protein
MTSTTRPAFLTGWVFYFIATFHLSGSQLNTHRNVQGHTTS